VPMSTPALIVAPDGRPTWRYRPDYFRAAFEQSGLDLQTVARRGGWSDGTPVARAIGLRPDTRKNGRPPSVRRSVSYRTAVRLAQALGLDYYEVGV